MGNTQAKEEEDQPKEETQDKGTEEKEERAKEEEDQPREETQDKGTEEKEERTKEDEDKLKEETQDKGKEEKEERKASLIITPWSNKERTERISEIFREKKEDELVSTIFNIGIQELKPKLDEDSATTTNKKQSKDKVVRSVMFKHDSPTLETAAFIHSVVDSIDVNKTVDYITLALEVEIAKNLVIYTCHQYNGDNWTRTEIQQEAGSDRVEANVSDFTTETIFFTMRYMSEEIVVPSGGFDYTNDFCANQRITFPEGAVDGNMKITINTMSVEVECKRKRLKEEMDSDTNISCLSDIVYVHHTQPFKKKLLVRLKLDRLFDDDKSHNTFLFHCDDEGNLTVLDVEMRKVPKTDVGGDDNIYEAEVDNFSAVGAFRGKSRNPRAVSKTYGLGKDQCRILVFLHKVGKDLHLWSDIVPEQDLEERERELQNRKDMIDPMCTKSPSVPVKNLGRINIILLSHGRMVPASEVPSNSMFMYYDRNAREIYNHFPVVPNKGIKSEHGIIQYEVDTTPKRLVHTAYISAELLQKYQPPTRPLLQQPGGFFSEKSLYFLARELETEKIWQLMLQLGINTNQINNLRSENKTDDNKYKLSLLMHWNNKNIKELPENRLVILCNALREVEMTLIAEVLESVYNENRALKPDDFSDA